MTTEADFLASIAAAPEDATTKLVFADWLEEREDHRAGLLRRILRFQELSGDAAGCYERGGILPLLDGRFAEWLAPLAEWGDVFVSERGLLRLEIDGERARQARWRPDPGWGWVSEVVAVAEQGWEEGRWPLRAAVRLAERLGRPGPAVRLAILAGTRPDGTDLSLLRSVAALDLLGRPVNAEGFERVLFRGGMPALREVRCRRLNRETLQRLAHATADVPLRALEFGITRETPRPEFVWLAQSAACAGLEDLTFHGDEPLGPDDLATLARAPWFGQLRRLALPLGWMNPEDLAPLAAGGPLARLERLTLRAECFESDDLRALAAGPARRSLRCLDLSAGEFLSGAAHILAGCPHLGELRQLSLWGLPHGDLELQELASLPWPHLAALTVGGSKPTRAGVRALLDGSLLPRLVYLGLPGHDLGGEALRDLADSPAVAGLLGLDLSGRPLRDEQLTPLIESRHLSRRCTLKLSAPRAAPATLERLRGRYRHVEIEP